MATKPGTLLVDVAGFPSAVIDQLHTLWLTTAEELVSTANQAREGRYLNQATGPELLAAFLALPRAEVDALVELARAVLPEGESFDEGDMELAFGAIPIENVVGPEDEPFGFADDLPPEVDLRDGMPPVRDQGNRGTCVAHAAVAVREFLVGNRGDPDLSEQFVYWACKQRDGNPESGGTYIKFAMDVLKTLGVCTESVWPYSRYPVANNEGQGPPPADAVAHARSFQVTTVQELNGRCVDTLKRMLAKGQPIAFDVPVFRYLERPYFYRVGDFRLCLPGEPIAGGHAMCMVGYIDDTDVPGGGIFLAENSWGPGFGANGEVAPGYCRIPYEYIRRYGWEAFTAYAD